MNLLPTREAPTIVEWISLNLKEVDGILIPGGFGDRGTEGKIAAANYARIQLIPYFGICLGMQIAVIEFARNACGLKGASSTEFDAGCEHPIITILEDQKEVTEKGASMRLGSSVTDIIAGSLAFEIYHSATISERHRHRYEYNQVYREQLESKGQVVSGTSPDGKYVEIIELKDHPFFIACQFHPEFLSKPNQPHPLFHAFVGAAKECKKRKRG